jgi:hypothetical protein
MRSSLVPFLILGFVVGGCSAGQISSVPPGSSSLNAIHPAPKKTQGPIITPSYLGVSTVDDSYFEVHGRFKRNHGAWTSRSNCHALVRIRFDGYNTDGSQYSVGPGSSSRQYGMCKYTATNPHGREGSVQIFYSTDADQRHSPM